MKTGKTYKVRCRYRRQISDYVAINHVIEFCGVYAFTQGNLDYFMTDEFRFWPLSKDEIISITEI